MTTAIRNATESDVPAVAKLASKLALVAGEAGSQKGGFLVSGFTNAEYSQFVATAEHFYVCVEDDIITGFLLAYSAQSVDPANTVESLLKYVYIDDFVLIKQIAVDPEHNRTGVGTRLYRFLIERMPNTALLSAIVLDPPNAASVHFHERFEFRYLLDVKADDGLPRGIWHRPVQGRENEKGPLRIGVADQTSTVDRLQCQWEVAAQLYCHEDNLNWAKIASLLTLVVLLGAAFSFFWQFPPAPDSAFPVWGLLFLGLIVHGIYILSIASGLRYMMARKECVIKLEERIAERDGNMVPLVTKTKGPSITARLLYVFPFLSLITWSVGTILILIRIYW
jgi:ribosomal protein S18 acetylase RimI-like enzyme